MLCSDKPLTATKPYARLARQSQASSVGRGIIAALETPRGVPDGRAYVSFEQVKDQWHHMVVFVSTANTRVVDDSTPPFSASDRQASTCLPLAEPTILLEPANKTSSCCHCEERSDEASPPAGWNGETAARPSVAPNDRRGFCWTIFAHGEST